MYGGEEIFGLESKGDFVQIVCQVSTHQTVFFYFEEVAPEVFWDIGRKANLWSLCSLRRMDLVFRAWPQTRHP